MSATETQPEHRDVYYARGKRILVQPDETPEYAGSLILPEQAREKPIRGTIVSVSEEAAAQGYADGDRVIFSKYGGIEIDLDDETLLVLNTSDILLVVRREPVEEPPAAGDTSVDD